MLSKYNQVAHHVRPSCTITHTYELLYKFPLFFNCIYIYNDLYVHYLDMDCSSVNISLATVYNGILTNLHMLKLHLSFLHSIFWI